MKKKLMGILLTTVMTVSLLAGCGNGGETPAETPAEAPTETEAEAPEEEAAETPAAEEKVLKIGLVAGVTGTEPLEGERMVQGCELALEEYNAAGKVNGITIEFEIQDSQGTTDGMMNAAQKLIADRCQILIGPQKSAHVMAIGDMMDEAQVPFIAGATSPKLKGAYDYLFTCRTNDMYMANIGAKICDENIGAKKVGIFYTSDDYGAGGFSVAEEYFKEKGIEYVAEAYNSGDTDVSGQILSLMNADVDCMFMWSHGVDLPVVARTMGQLGWDKPVVTASGTAQKMYLDLCEAEWVEGWMAVAEYVETNPKEIVQHYAKSFKEATGEAGELYGSTYYGAFQAVVQALRDGAEPTSASLYEYLKQVKDVEGVLGTLTCDEDQFMMHEALLIQVEDLTPVVIEAVTL